MKSRPKRVFFFVPFAVLTASEVASYWFEDNTVIGYAWLASLVACVLCVPVLSRYKLWVGYLALIYSLGLLVLQLSRIT